jgi:hypothetical protein
MDEARYWLSLEYRLCREFAGMKDLYLRYLWCDGFTPQKYLMDDPVPRITGRVWICDGLKQAEWEFTLFLPHPVRSREAIDWAEQFPAENVTQWLAVDRRKARIEIEPSAAVPDLA